MHLRHMGYNIPLKNISKVKLLRVGKQRHGSKNCTANLLRSTVITPVYDSFHTRYNVLKGLSNIEYSFVFINGSKVR